MKYCKISNNKQSDFYVGSRLENMDVVSVVDRGDRHRLEGMQVHLVDALEVASVHEFLLLLGDVPQADRAL